MSRLKKFARWSRANCAGILRKPYSTLLIDTDASGWVLDEEAKELQGICDQLAIPSYLSYRPASRLQQCVHYTSFFSIENPKIFLTRHRVSFDYFHGKPNQLPAFRRVFDSMQAHREKISRVRLSYSEMLPYALEAGISRDRIFIIPIGINPRFFSVRTAQTQKQTRIQFGLPENAFVIGSFQKDGEGWGDGLEPKWVKGPDIFLKTLAALKPKIPELHVLLTGPARGFVKRGLEKLQIPYRHFNLSHYSEIGKYYHAIDAYLVSSREEGGPKAVLESMLSGIPLVTTRVGQAIDLVVHKKNGLIAEIENVEELANHIFQIYTNPSSTKTWIAQGIETAQRQTHAAQLPAWKNFFNGYIE